MDADMRILLVEDNERLAALLAEGLRRQGWSADTVESLESAEAALKVAAYEAVVVDRGLPDGDGLNLVRSVRALRPAPPVLMLTARGAVPEVCEGLDRGADDYLVKPVALAELVSRLRAATRRVGAGTAASPQRIGRLDFDPVSRDLTVGGVPLDPPPRERTILESLVRAAPRPVAKEVLEDRLASFERSVQANAVEVYVHRLRKRLKDAGAEVSIETVRGLGYRLIAGEERPSG